MKYQIKRDYKRKRSIDFDELNNTLFTHLSKTLSKGKKRIFGWFLGEVECLWIKVTSGDILQLVMTKFQFTSSVLQVLLLLQERYCMVGFRGNRM